MIQPNCTIRPAVVEDGAALVPMVIELMVHLGDDAAFFDADRFCDDAFGGTPQFSVLVAEQDAALVGYALFHDAYEPAFAARGVYLADLFVAESARRGGIGRALIAAVARDGRRRGRTFVWWVARGDDARAFYRTLTDAEQPVTAHAITFETFQKLADAGS